MMNALIKLFMLCVLVGAIIAGFFVHDAFFIKPTGDAKPVVIEIENGTTVSVIAKQLQENHLISHPLFFKWFVSWTHAGSKLQSGTFALLPNTSLASLLLTLTNPKNSEVQITIPEGFTNDQIEDRLANAFENFDRAAFKQQTNGLQGYLFPDTYRFAKNASVKEIVQKMKSTLDRRLAENSIPVFDGGDIPKNTYPQNFSFFQVLTFASLIEKEVQTPEDMRHIAGIFVNRLSIGMALQSDAYPDSYKVKGLPPAPICNPGMNAIIAALHPDKTSDLYFIAPPDHAPVYAKTLDEQIKNQRKYLK